MPGTSRTQRAEAKYNVVFDYPNLGLHTAAASGNLGLVKYALDHGQPVNSALDGVLPLHAASFGGSDLVVRLLIEYGADVNAPRLPRRYSTDKHRGSTPPLVITGASGSTSLHFACMHGHMTVILTLLLHGAHPDRTDKHGMTPEMIARQNGYTDCADVLQQWAQNRDRDLRERDVLTPHPAEDHAYREEKSHNYCGRLDCLECATRKRIRVKRSIDNAFHMLRHTSSSHSAANTPPHSASALSASNSMQPPSPTDRPFGEYTFYPVSDSATDDLPPRRPSLPQVLEVPHIVTTPNRSRRPSNLSGTSSHRPRSAGSDADQCAGQRVKGKISLLNIFKRGTEGTPDSTSPSSSAVTSASQSPSAPSALAISALTSRSSDGLAPSPTDASPAGPSAGNQLHSLMLGETSSSAQSIPEPRKMPSRGSLRSVAIVNEALEKASPSTRPGILRAVHGRSSSSTQSVPSDSSRTGSGPPSVRALRFDPNSHGAASGTRRPESRARASRTESRSPSRTRGRGSFNSVRSHSPSSAWGMRFENEPEHMGAPSPAAGDGYIEEEEEEEYGGPVEPQVGVNELDMRLQDLNAHKSRRMSIESRASDLDSQDTVNHIFDCPFSIHYPPPEEDDEISALRSHRASLDSRVRGNSMSSMITDSSGYPSSSVPTPALQQSNLPTPYVVSPTVGQTELPSPGEALSEKKDPAVVSVTPASPAKRVRGPLDIDIRSISSHAQAEALVQRTQQRILVGAESSDEEDGKTFGIALNDGHTPLSAKLAALGESLAIERKFKEDEDKKRRRSLVMEPISEQIFANEVPGVQRKLSLQERAHSDPATRLRRPHTADGEPHTESPTKFLSPKPSKTNLLSVSDPDRRGKLLTVPGMSSSSTFPTPHARSDSLPIERPFIPRSRTPDPDSSWTSSTVTGGFGTPLTRYPTCPAEDLPRNDLLTKQERQAARAQKLAKMGFSSSGTDTWKESPAYARNQRQHRFGLKTLVQSLTGRA
ncbi:Ankyrin repeat protein [Phanerochaete sordida]|uniref:Ankyrin repeat protein n=1 Tax=Phanerochaete sordida TaxID=48140 RepID=A0A9P3LJN9_9APHY|nr:Ankyrin repeat protein [Phanerochaete sordida]